MLGSEVGDTLKLNLLPLLAYGVTNRENAGIEYALVMSASIPSLIAITVWAS